MQREKRGLSTVIVTLILILVSIVAVGVVWVVVRNIIQTGTEGVGLSQFSLSAKIMDVSVNDSSNNVSFIVKRNAGKGELEGISFVFSSGADTEVITQNVSLKELEEKRFYFNLIKLNVSNLISISIIPLIKQDGKEISGIALDKYNFGENKNNIPGQTTCIPVSNPCGTAVCGNVANGTCGQVSCGACGTGFSCVGGSCVLNTSGVLCGPSRTYYIDFQNGNDANNGTCSNSAWKTHPYMNGSTVSYTHRAGDRFIFKGGVTWPYSVLPMTISTGGNSSNIDYYGVNKSWYNGSSWSKPIFNAQALKNNIIRVKKIASYIKIDNFDIQGQAATSTDWAFQCSIALEGSINVTMSNLYVHKWSKGVLYDGINLPGSIYDDGYYGGICNFGAWMGNSITDSIVVEYSDIGNNDCPDINSTNGNRLNYGACFFYAGEVRYSKIHDCPNAFLLGGFSIHHNEIYNISFDTFDKEQHTNVAYISNSSNQSIMYFYNNYIHDVTSGSGAIYPNPPGTFYIYNNLISNSTGHPIIDIDTYWGTGDVYVLSNTFYIPSSDSPLRGGILGGGRVPTNKLVVQNNHVISLNPPANIVSSPENVINLIESNNLIQSITQANNNGYTLSNLFIPTSSSSLTVNTGISLSSIFTTDKDGVSRPQGSAWDIGAYEYVL